MELPVNFEEKVRLPPSVNGGYPYRISARDLMLNFRFLMNQMPKGESTNDILIFDGENWALLSGPSPAGTHVLGCVDGVMQWIATEECA